MLIRAANITSFLEVLNAEPHCSARLAEADTSSAFRLAVRK
jgi:hypothetical protein